MQRPAPRGQSQKMRCEHSNGRSVAKKQVVHTLDGLEWCRLWAVSCEVNGVGSEMARSEESGWLVGGSTVGSLDCWGWESWVVGIAGWLGEARGCPLIYILELKRDPLGKRRKAARFTKRSRPGGKLNTWRANAH